MKDDKQQPNILIRNVILLSSSFERENEFLLPLHAECHFNYEKKINEIGNEGQCVLTANVSFSDSKNESAAKIKCSFVGLFSSEGDQNMSMSEFLEYNAAAHVLPFLREHVANLTIKSGIPPLYLPPYNIMALVESGSKDTSPASNSEN